MGDTQEELTRQQEYEYLAHQIEREDSLINTRITWMLTFEGFLFAALALVANKENIGTAVYKVLKYALPLMGIAVGMLAFLGVQAALSALEVLKNRWDPEKFKGYPQPFGGPRPHAFGALYSQGLPLVVIVTWATIFLWLLYLDFKAS